MENDVTKLSNEELIEEFEEAVEGQSLDSISGIHAHDPYYDPNDSKRMEKEYKELKKELLRRLKTKK